MTLTDGPKGPGLYFFKYGGGSDKITPPQDQDCGWVCSVGFAATQVLGCNSVKGCVVSAALSFTPVGGLTKGVRLMKTLPSVARGLKIAKESKVLRALVRGGKAGARAAKALKTTRAAKRAYGGLSEAGNYGIRTYYQLRKVIAGTGLQAHHLIEARFKVLFGEKAGQMLSIVVTQAEHQAFTNRWRRLIPYGIEGTGKATRESVMTAARDVYSKNPAILETLGR